MITQERIAKHLSSDNICTLCGWLKDPDAFHFIECDAYACDNLTCNNSYHSVNGVGRVCDSCINQYYYCDDCNIYTETEHVHAPYGCMCESPQLDFSVPLGDSVLSNDSRGLVTLPEGLISNEGIYQISQTVRESLWETYRILDKDANGWDYYRYDPAHIDFMRRIESHIESLGNEWQTRQGNFTKRLSRLLYQQAKMKLDPETLSRVGNIASDHSRASDAEIEVTRQLNLPPDEFCNEDSCWWQGYSDSRCTLKSNGGFGIRTFSNGESDNYPTGRAWVLPLRENADKWLTPTFDTVKPSAYAVFNGYGDLEGYSPARILARMTGLTYKKVGLQTGPMYINSGRGYLVGPESVLADRSDVQISLSTHSDVYTSEKDSANV